MHSNKNILLNTYSFQAWQCQTIQALFKDIQKIILIVIQLHKIKFDSLNYMTKNDLNSIRDFVMNKTFIK